MGYEYGFTSDGLSTEHYCGWKHKPDIASAIEAGHATIRSRRPNLNIAWRIYTCLWAAENAMRIEGDFLECGVFTGIYSAAVMDYTQTTRKFWLLDTFTGIPESSLSHAEKINTRMNRKYNSDVFDEVKNTFAQYENVELVKGIVPDTLEKVTSKKLAYVSIDMNAAQPEMAAAEFAWWRMSKGAIMIFDDYGFEMHMIQRAALDYWAKNRGISIFALPTGQGIVIK